MGYPVGFFKTPLALCLRGQKMSAFTTAELEYLASQVPGRDVADAPKALS
jgi:hypothetical protein